MHEETEVASLCQRFDIEPARCHYGPADSTETQEGKTLPREIIMCK